MTRLSGWQYQLLLSIVFASGPGFFATHAFAQCDTWQMLADGVAGTGGVLCTCEFNGELIVGGGFTTPGQRIAAWDGTSWHTLGAGMNNPVRALAVYNGELIAGGEFSFAGGISASRIARWNGVDWQALGSGVFDDVDGLIVYNDELVAVGPLTVAGGHAVHGVAAWNGTNWHALGDPGLGIAWFEDAVLLNGELYAGGLGGVRHWDGTSWVAIGPSFDDAFRMEVYQNHLFVCGFFTTIGGQPANYIARWNGTAWQQVGGGMNNFVLALSVYHDDLIAGGQFTTAGGIAANRCARWDGVSWKPIGPGVGPNVSAAGTFGPELILGGTFQGGRIKRWQDCPSACCLPDQTCSMLSFEDCQAAGGVYNGVNQSCDPGGHCPDFCLPDLNDDGLVDASDLVEVITYWGKCSLTCPPSCNQDLNADCGVNVDDLLVVINGWGPCPYGVP